MSATLRALWARAVRWYQGHSQRDRRIIAAVGIAVGLYLLDIVLVEPVRAYRQGVADEIAAGQEQLERAARFTAAAPALRAERDELRRKLDQARGRLLPGDTATLGAAALQDKTNSIAAEKGLTVQSTQVMKDEAADPFRRVAVRLTLSAEPKPLAEFLSAVEYTQQLSIPFIEVSRRGATPGKTGPRTLQATVEVSGYVQQGKSGKAGGEHAEGEAAAEAASAEAVEGEAATPPTTTTPAAGGASTTVAGRAAPSTTTPPAPAGAPPGAAAPAPTPPSTVPAAPPTTGPAAPSTTMPAPPPPPPSTPATTPPGGEG